MNSPPKFAIPRFDVHQSSRVQHLCFLSSTFSRATIGVAVQVSRAHFLTPPPLSLISSVIYETHNKEDFDLNCTRFFFSRGKKGGFWTKDSHHQSLAFFWTQIMNECVREIWCVVNLDDFWLLIFWKLPGEHPRTRENERYFVRLTEISPIIKE